MVHTLRPELIELAAAQRGVLLGSQISPLIGDRRLARFVHDGTLIQLWRNAYAVGQRGLRTTSRLEAARLTLGRPVTACLQTAGQVHGFDLTGDTRTHIVAAHDWSSGLRGLVQQRAVRVRPDVMVSGHRITDLAETVVRVACCERQPEKVLATLDAALHRCQVDKNELAEVAACLRIRGIRLVRELIPLADGRSESPGESWLRWVCLEAGFAAPTPQVWVLVEGSVPRRIDLGWPELLVGCEYDGVEFHTGAALTRDRDRYNGLHRAGWLLQGVTSAMIWQGRGKLVADIRSMLAERGA